MSDYQLSDTLQSYACLLRCNSYYGWWGLIPSKCAERTAAIDSFPVKRKAGNLTWLACNENAMTAVHVRPKKTWKENMKVNLASTPCALSIQQSRYRSWLIPSAGCWAQWCEIWQGTNSLRPQAGQGGCLQSCNLGSLSIAVSASSDPISISFQLGYFVLVGIILHWLTLYFIYHAVAHSHNSEGSSWSTWQ